MTERCYLCGASLDVVARQRTLTSYRRGTDEPVLVHERVDEGTTTPHSTTCERRGLLEVVTSRPQSSGEAA